MERAATPILEYARLNKLIINSRKSKLLRFRPQLTRNYGELSIFINGDEIFKSQSISYLGVSLQCNLSYILHIVSLKWRISHVIGFL